MIELSVAADKLLEKLKGKGVKLSLNNKKLRVEGKLPDNLKEEVRKNKEGLIQLVNLGEHRWSRVDDCTMSTKGVPIS